MQFAADTKLQEEIRQAIIDGFVSVYRIANGDSLESTDYSVVGKDGTAYDFEQSVLYKEKDATYYEYTISVDGYDVASTILSDKEKTFAQPTLAILRLFQACSSKLIYQEMQNTVHNIQTPNKFKVLN
ncbi:MAG: hypothetical protein II208_00190 [Alphaproteobacteria bacterium]|nr:hypothetical protein [Alphaproteobacteria bacterium]